MIIEEFAKLKVEMEELWEEFLEIIRKYPNILGEPSVDDRR
jgi:hypothetical protein